MRAQTSVPYDELPRHVQRHLAGMSLLRSSLLSLAELLGYFTLPMTGLLGYAGLLLLGGVLLLGWLLAWQLHAIAASPYPRVRMLGALSVSVPLFFVIFATTYFVMESSAPGTFNHPLSRLDALYFTVTVFATVGFGDLVALSEPARAVVLVQMVGDLVIVGFVARAFVRAMELGLSRRGARD
ncbi:MAG TPA: potassium channel family protein [Nocardioidaceae bacterium]|nr:potassium channel family protein [Nocardioidaceae bacterium]